MYSSSLLKGSNPRFMFLSNILHIFITEELCFEYSNEIYDYPIEDLDLIIEESFEDYIESNKDFFYKYQISMDNFLESFDDEFIHKDYAEGLTKVSPLHHMIEASFNFDPYANKKLMSLLTYFNVNLFQKGFYKTFINKENYNLKFSVNNEYALLFLTLLPICSDIEKDRKGEMMILETFIRRTLRLIKEIPLEEISIFENKSMFNGLCGLLENFFEEEVKNYAAEFLYRETIKLLSTFLEYRVNKKYRQKFLEEPHWDEDVRSDLKVALNKINFIEAAE